MKCEPVYQCPECKSFHVKQDAAVWAKWYPNQDEPLITDLDVEVDPPNGFIDCDECGACADHASEWEKPSALCYYSPNDENGREIDTHDRTPFCTKCIIKHDLLNKGWIYRGWAPATATCEKCGGTAERKTG